MAHSAPVSPFVGHWQATDIDGSDMRLTIAGPPNGPFQITWTESYLSFCDGEAGIIRGTGLLNEGDANLLEAELHVECLTSGASMDTQLTFRYHPATNTLTTRYENGMIIIWQRPGRPQPPPPTLDLRVNYGHDWVESFYEAGHMAWITVTESDGVTVKATAELVTEPKDFWGGATGFNTQPEDWDPSPPDIQPYDWVYGWIDNGASAQVQIGDISGMIDLAADSIEGTIYAPWFSDEVNVECHPWGAPEPQPEMKYDVVQPDGIEPYSCSWAGEWDIQLGQDVGVGYVGPDGHWVANAFVTNARTIASANGDWLWTTDFTPWAPLSISIYESKDAGAVLLWEGSKTADEWGFVMVDSSDHDLDLVPGNYLTVSDDVFTKGLVLESITMEIFDVDQDFIAGTAPPGRDVWVAAGPQDLQTGMWVVADPESGGWTADFKEVVDITEEMRTWSYAQIFDDDGDANEANPPPLPNTRFTVFPEWNYLEGYEWPEGAVVSISVAEKEVCSTEAVSGSPEGDPSNTFFSLFFPEGCVIGAGDLITLSSGSLSLTHQVPELAIVNINLDADTVAGTAVFDPEQYVLHTWIHGVDESYMQLSAEGGTWLADFGSQGFDLQPGMGGRVELVDQSSNATAAEWWIPNPVFTAFPEQEAVEGWEWPLGAVVHLSIDDPATPDSPDHEQDETVILTPWGSGQLWVWFDFAGSYDMKPGDLVTLTDGVTTREHTVRNLAITTVDAEADTVAGTADPGAEMHVWPHEFGEYELQPTAGEDGTWLAEFGPLGFDLEEGMCGRAEIRDEVGNATAADWCVPPPPRILVQITDDWFEGQNFAPNAEQTYEVYDTEGGTLLLSGTMQADDHGTAGAWVGDQMDLAPGNYVVISDGSATKDLVLEALTFDVFDLTQGLLQGTAPPPAGRLVWVGIGWENDAWTMEVTTDPDGNWVADFNMPVPNDYLWVAAQVFDPDGDASEVRPSQIINGQP